MLTLLLPGLFAGLVAVGVTVAIERWGGRVGGLIGTLPSTIVPASLGLWFRAADAPAEVLAGAMHTVPAGMLLNAGFLFLWRVLPPRLPSLALGPRLALMSFMSLAAWAVGAVGLTLSLQAGGGAGRLFGVVSTLVLVGFGALSCLATHPSPRGSRPVGPTTLLARGLLAGLAVSVAVWLADVGGPVAAGVASVFPAIFLTTMVSLWLSQGEAVPAGAVGPMMLGSGAVASYAVFAAALFPVLGPVAGACAAWVLAALTTTLPAWAWLGRRARGGQ